MKRFGVVLLTSIGAVLALPVSAYAIDHVVLSVTPAKLAKSGTLGAWSLDGRIVDASFSSDREIFGVSLRRSFLQGRAQELHAFRAGPARTLTFDGQTGHWGAHFGAALTVRMAISATGSAQPVAGDVQGCRGAFVQVPVVLRGTFALRSGTRLFKTVRRTRLGGTVTFNSGGAVDCTLPAVATCIPSTSLTAGGRSATLIASPDSGGWMTLAFADRIASAVDATWYHVMTVTQFSPLMGGLPSISVGVPAKLPVQGRGVFTATDTSSDRRGACQAVSARGAFKGTFRTRFTGWGRRTFTSTASDYAAYSEQR